GLVVLGVGALIAYLIRFLLLRILARTRFDAFLERNGIIGRSPILSSTAGYEWARAAQHRDSIRQSEPYQSYFGRSPARRWRPDESVTYESPNITEQEGISHEAGPSSTEPEETAESTTSQHLERGSLTDHPPLYENKTARFSEERYSFDTSEPDHPSVSADAQKFLTREEFNPERHQSADTPESSEPQPKLRRAADFYRIRVGTRVVAN